MKKVFIDAGHGGKDPGAVGNGLNEKDINLTVSLCIKKKLESEYDGAQVIMSRATDKFLELSERTSLANKAGADILVSVHVNAGGGAGGFESFKYINGSTASAALQNVLHTEIMRQLKSYGVIDRGQKSGNLHMVRESKMPAVLTENLFIDVASDVARLKQAKLIEAIVNGHVTGIAKYLGLRKKVMPSVNNNIRVIVNEAEIADRIVVVQGVIYIPLRAVREALGAQISWNNETKTATLTI